MRKLFLIALALAPLTSRGASPAISRGGFGMLFPDQNSTRNAGELARMPGGVSIQAAGAKYTGTHEQQVAFSATASTKGWAITGYGARYGMDPTDSAQSNDIMGGALGYAPGAFAFAVAAEKEHDLNTSIARVVMGAVLRGTMSYQSKGPLVFGVGLQTSLDRPTGQHQEMEFALGLKGMRAMLETVHTISTQSSHWTSGIFGKWQGDMFYAAAGGKYLGLQSAVQLMARAGLVWRAFDVSGFIAHTLADNENPFHGVALRVSF